VIGFADPKFPGKIPDPRRHQTEIKLSDIIAVRHSGVKKARWLPGKHFLGNADK
jgi:hypothetical protein